MAPFYGWDSTASRLQSHYEEVFYFLPSILSFPKKLLPTIFQFSPIDGKFWCDVFRDLVLFVQFKKCEKHSMKECYFS